MDGLLLNVNELDIKKLSSLTDHQLHLQSPSLQQQPKSAKPHFLPTSSCATNVVNGPVTSTLTLSDDIVNVQSLVDSGGQTFVSLAPNGTSDNSAQATAHQSFLQTTSTTASHGQPAMMIDQIDIQSLVRENQKLASIARICIHLVDRCRNLNKSKQFTDDLIKLSNLVESFNQNSNFTGTLPTLNNAGLVTFASVNGSQSLTSTSAITTVASSSSSKQSLLSPNTTINMVFIPIAPINDGPQHQHQQQQPTLIQHFITTVDDRHQLLPQIELKSKQNKRQQSQQQQQTCRKQNIQVQIQSQQTQSDPSNDLHQQSILFKKLTDTISAPAAAPANSTAQNGSQVQLAIPLHLNDQGTLFSIVNQLDHSNIENTPNISNKKASNGKVYKCTLCDKVFANSYNLNRHKRSHTGFQPFECYYEDCRKRFNYNYHLKRHLETHTGERPFVCTWPHCDQRFNRKYNLNRHLWIHTEHKNKQVAAVI